MISKLSSTSVKSHRFMASFFHFSIAFLFGVFPFNASAQWVSETSGSGSSLFGVYFLNSSTGWTCGTGGTILKTIDSGGTWASQASGITQTLLSLSFPTSSNGWAVGATNAGNRVRMTSSGGTTWSTSPDEPTIAIHDVHFLTDTEGWISGAAGGIYKWDDVNSLWVDQSSSASGQRMRSIYFIDNQTGWATGEGGHILRTTDGGALFEKEFLSVTTFYAVTFIDANTGWVVGTDGAIRKSTDGGATWVVQASGTTETLRAVSFANANTGWIVGTGGIILKTTDGGATWGMQDSGETEILYDLWVFDTNTALAVGANGTIVKTSNGGGAVTFPVELMSFTAKEFNKKAVQLNWETASETNNKGFSVEWSKDANTWQELAFITGNGTVTETQQYQFLHQSPIHGVNYYRLKQLDFDGAFEYSFIRSLEREGEETKFIIYPNPVKNGQLMISLVETGEHAYSYVIYNLLGMSIAKGQSVGLGKGRIEIDVQSLALGMYHLELFKDDELIGTSSFLR